MCKKIILSVFMLLVATAIPAAPEQQEAHAESDAALTAKDMMLGPDDVLIIVHGIVCSFCAQGVMRKLSRLTFIDQSKYKKGVRVEIENQRVTIAIRPDQKADLRQVFQSIRAGGYEPVAAYVRDGKSGVVHKKPEDLES